MNRYVLGGVYVGLWVRCLAREWGTVGGCEGVTRWGGGFGGVNVNGSFHIKELTSETCMKRGGGG